MNIFHKLFALPYRMRDAMKAALGDGAVYVFPTALSLPLQQQRIKLIQARLQIMMFVFAISLPLWSVIEYSFFPSALWSSLFKARVLAGTSLGCFLYFGNKAFRSSVENIWFLYFELAALFIVPTLFYVFCIRLPEPIFDLNSYGAVLASSYKLLPFVILACLAFFPLTIVESGSILGPFLLAYYGTATEMEGTYWTTDLGMMWVMAIVALICAALCCSQLHILLQLITYSSYDHLTKCLLRGSGEEIVRIFWHYSIRQEKNLSVAFVDLDYFKQVNDRFGHAVGDKVLAETAEKIRISLRKSDTVIRWGGEEFLVILPDTSLENATKVMHRVASSGFCKLPDGKVQTASVGISERINEAATDERRLIQAADERLYKAKTDGRSCILGSCVIKMRN